MNYFYSTHLQNTLDMCSLLISSFNIFVIKVIILLNIFENSILCYIKGILRIYDTQMKAADLCCFYYK